MQKETRVIEFVVYLYLARCLFTNFNDTFTNIIMMLICFDKVMKNPIV